MSSCAGPDVVRAIRFVRCLVAALAFTVCTSAWLEGQSAPTRNDAASFKRKVAAIARAGTETPVRPGRTTVNERELNAYLLYDLPQPSTSGVVEPSVSLVGGGKLTARAVVDLDAVRKGKSSTGMFDPMNFFTGRVPITVAGLLKTARGVGTLELESVTLGGVPVPLFVLQEIVAYYSRTPGNPTGLRLDAPFDLPTRIQEIQVEASRAIIVQ